MDRLTDGQIDRNDRPTELNSHDHSSEQGFQHLDFPEHSNRIVQYIFQWNYTSSILSQ